MIVEHMPLSQAAVMGVLQGLAEFAPISSSAHLVLVPWLFHPLVARQGWLEDPGQAFDASLHLGTALALILYFWPQWRQLIGALIGHLTGKKTWENADVRIAWMIIVATIPGALFGVLLEKKFDLMFDTKDHPWAPGAIGALLAIMGIVLWAADHFGRKNRSLSALTMKDAVLIGLSQALALFPGVSRSGATITAGLGLDLDRETAARFSFLMATPITLGAGLYKMLKMRHSTEPHPQAAALALGIVVSAVVGYAVIKWLLSYLQRQNMNLFVGYRIAAGILVIVVWLLRGMH
ncbi:MAG: undecaprenyl-diphosphatase UppP [Chloroflexi bacterium]|nr:undecaprenyl-diphosphatase UppP [Chloroflexota bacterium]